MRDNQTLRKYAIQQKDDRERQARRDAYATAAMPEVMRSRETISLDTGEMQIVAEVAYAMADAMEAARLKDWSK